MPRTTSNAAQRNGAPAPASKLTGSNPILSKLPVSKTAGAKTAVSKIDVAKSAGAKPKPSKPRAVTSAASKMGSNESVDSLRPHANGSSSHSERSKAPRVANRVGSGGAIATVKHQAKDLGESMITWGKAHPIQAALAAAAVVAGVTALVSFVRHRRVLIKRKQNATSRDTMHFNVNDLLTGQVTTPPIPGFGDSRSSFSAITPTRERTTPSHHFRPTRMP